MDETTLGQRFSTGGEEVLTAAIGHYGQPLLRYCHHVLCDYHEAQDAVQIAFIKAYETRSRFHSGTNLRAWLYKIAFRTCVDLLRRRRRQLFLPPSDAGWDPGYIGPELRQALESLSPEDRGLLFGRILEECSYEELSQIYGKSAATLRKRYERARRKLAGILTAGQSEAHKEGLS
ncbi:MAG: sigma-70 family RNA polymerase sigma factor [Oscillospiraceae bacterium]|nr:sigma-70 family RNA polymerase sigma factor [Oscillospiraceae bacterium]